MAKKEETGIQTNILLAVNDGKTCALFRNNRGVAIYRDKYGKIRDRVAYGVGPNGAGDGVGWVRVLITPEMVGQTVAVFLSEEIKTPIGKADANQTLWHNNVLKAGGISGFARTPEEALEIIKNAPMQIINKNTPI